MNQINQEEIFKYKYWYINDESLAKQMGISTDEKDVGDLYLLRKQSIFTASKMPNIKLNQYDFISEKILTAEEMKNDPQAAQAKVVNLAFNSPVLVKDVRQFFALAGMFKAVVFVVYSDPKDKDNHEKVMKAMVEARNKIPLQLKSDQEGSFEMS
jgi:hypothetical protein